MIEIVKLFLVFVAIFAAPLAIVWWVLYPSVNFRYVPPAPGAVAEAIKCGIQLLGILGVMGLFIWLACQKEIGIGGAIFFAGSGFLGLFLFWAIAEFSNDAWTVWDATVKTAKDTLKK